MSSKSIKQLENEYVKLHSQIMNSFNPTAEQWARLDEISKEIFAAQVGINSLVAAGFTGLGTDSNRTYTVIKKFDGSVQEWLYQKGKE